MKNPSKTTTFKLSLLSIAVMTAFASGVASADNSYGGNANTYVYGNSDNSAGNEGVFISSNGNANAAISLTTNGAVSIQSGGQNTGSMSYDPSTYINTSSIGGIGSGTTYIGTGGASTNIGRLGYSTNTVSGYSNTIEGYSNTIQGYSNTITGDTYINESTNAVTNINTGNSTGTVSVGNQANTTNLNSSTNNIGVNSYATTNNIGTGSVQSTNNIGNTTSTTTVNSYAANSQQVLQQNSATTQVTTNGSGSTPLNGGRGSILSATAVGGTGFVIQEKGQFGQQVNVNNVGTTTQDTAAVVVVNAAGNANGVVANQNQATLAGGNGTGATSLTMTNNVAMFGNQASGAPIKVTGVADGTGAFDAVNYRQLQAVASGVAGTAAMANIPVSTGANGKNFAIGVGMGNYMGQTSLALGGSYRIMEGAYIKASVASSNTNNGYSMGSNQNTVYGLGAGISF